MDSFIIKDLYMRTKFNIKLFFVSVMMMVSTFANAEVSWYGQINRGFLGVNDGHNKNIFFVDSAYDNSLAGIKGEARLSDNPDNDIKSGGMLELWVMPNVSNDVTANAVSQLNKHGKSGNIQFGIVDSWVTSSKAGKISLGRGALASKNTGTVTLSGTDLISYAGASDMAGGMYFHPQGAARSVQSTDPQVGGDGSIFDPLSGGGIKDRVRYDSPKFGAFIISTSIGKYPSSDSITKAPIKKHCADVALTYEDTVGEFKLKGAAAIIKHSKDNNIQSKTGYDGSFAILHTNTGLNAAVSLGEQRNQIDPTTQTITNSKNRKFSYIQIGKQTDLITYGKTNFAVDYWSTNNSASDYDKARACSIGVVQKLDKLKTELYFGIRNYKYEKPGQKYDRILAALLGFRISFAGKVL